MRRRDALKLFGLGSVGFLLPKRVTLEPKEEIKPDLQFSESPFGVKASSLKKLRGGVHVQAIYYTDYRGGANRLHEVAVVNDSKKEATITLLQGSHCRGVIGPVKPGQGCSMLFSDPPYVFGPIEALQK